MSLRRLITASERSKLDPFIVATGDASPRDQRDLMERPFFSLAKARRTAPILYESAGGRVEDRSRTNDRNAVNPSFSDINR
jgi:plasmid replication initiation protein